MEGIFGRHISSPLFTFRIGPEKKDVTVHSGPLGDLSPALDALIKGQMSEAQLRRADWPDVNVDTFTRLCEFAYLQDYTPPPFQQSLYFNPPSSRKKSKKKKRGLDLTQDSSPPEDAPAVDDMAETEADVEAPPEEAPPEPDSEPELEFDMDGTSPSFELPLKERRISNKYLQRAFSNLEYIPPQSTYQFEAKGNESTTQDFTSVLVGHAELYILADKYGIETLRQLVLHKVHQTLRTFTVYESDVPCIIEFLGFVYQNTPLLSEKIDPLRNLASRYVVSILGQIGDTDAFKEVLGEGGDFVIDFWHLVWTANRRF